MNFTLPRAGDAGKISKTLSYYAAFIVLGLITGVFGPTLPDLAQNTHTALNQISAIFAARSFGYLIGSWLAGHGYDRLPGHPLFAAALAVTALTFALIPVLPLLGLLIGVLLVLGMAEGAIDVGGNSLLVWVHGERVGPFMNGLHFFFGVGAFLAPLVIAQLTLATGEFRWAYWVLAALVAPVAFVFVRLPSPPIQHAAHQTHPTPTNPLLVALIAALLFVYVGAETGYGNWIFTYATQLNLANATDAALLTSTFWGAFTLGRLLGVVISHRAKPATIILLDLAGSLICVAIVALLPRSLPALWVGTLGAGLFMASIFPTAIALAGQRLTLTASITGWFLIGAGMGAMAFPWLIGQLLEPAGAAILIPIVLVSLVLDLGLLGGITIVAQRRTRRQSREPSE